MSVEYAYLSYLFIYFHFYVYRLGKDWGGACWSRTWKIETVRICQPIWTLILRQTKVDLKRVRSYAHPWLSRTFLVLWDWSYLISIWLLIYTTQRLARSPFFVISSRIHSQASARARNWSLSFFSRLSFFRHFLPFSTFSFNFFVASFNYIRVICEMLFRMKILQKIWENV